MVSKFHLRQPNLTPNFIGAWIIDDSLCDQLIDYFEENQTKQKQGVSGSQASIDLEKKNRIDVKISPKDINLTDNKILKKYFYNLFECYKLYNKEWPYLERMINHVEIGSFNIGRYKAGQHFQSVHCERAGLGSLQRLFAFMTYLNTVKDGGETYFNHYDLEIQPQKGLTLIWPAEWTHVHNGQTIKVGTKYIITGHLNFPAYSR
tara:strand:+ start:405 stop:1019 length:615 start_codon:yes stop_codon:yes gene_type:complete